MHRGQPRHCPACESSDGFVVSRKGMHALFECDGCGLLYRHPRETGEEMAKFYQSDYVESTMTTELPDAKELERLMATNFVGSQKDFSSQIAALQALGIEAGQRIFDFGANWGYLSFQLKNAGYSVDSFEISKPRAEFGRNLGIEIATDLHPAPNRYDCVYSSHVLEHVPNPAETLRQQFAMLKPGGFVVAHTPNGSSKWRAKGSDSFRKVWGLVHPVLLTDRFVMQQFGNVPLFVSSNDTAENVRAWNRIDRVNQDCDRWGLFFAIRKPQD